MVAPILNRPQFRPGQLVKHRRYGYRGVVVAFDPSCHASDEWYQRNQTEPLRAQPWYHVLVDGGEATTYAAETSLREDTSGRPVEHPLVPAFFSDFSGGRYVRNDRPWPAG
jgi:heat shock protein HspQ